ncbi:MAG: Mov34/MPN/PAD-1 family protein [Candidatus Methanofastidiosia archaeon]
MLIVYIDEMVLNGIFEHASHYGKNEAIGKLVGKPYIYPRLKYMFVTIWGYVPVESISTSISVKYSSRAAEHLAKDLLEDYSEDMVVGWYHSHPRMGCFLSSRDVETQQRNYPEWYQCALVVDPYSNEFKFFEVDDEGYPTEIEYYVYRRKPGV